MNSRPLAKGDPITHVMHRSDGTQYTQVAVYRSDDQSVWNSGWTDIAMEDEGVQWIRGHHHPESDEAKALLVAFAMVFG